MAPAKHTRKSAIGSLGKHEAQGIAPHHGGGCETVAHERKPKASVRAARHRRNSGGRQKDAPSQKRGDEKLSWRTEQVRQRGSSAREGGESKPRSTTTRVRKKRVGVKK